MTRISLEMSPIRATFHYILLAICLGLGLYEMIVEPTGKTGEIINVIGWISMVAFFLNIVQAATIEGAVSDGDDRDRPES